MKCQQTQDFVSLHYCLSNFMLVQDQQQSAGCFLCSAVQPSGIFSWTESPNHRGSFAFLGTIPPFNMDIGAEVVCSFISYSLKGEFLFSALEGSLPRL